MKRSSNQFDFEVTTDLMWRTEMIILSFYLYKYVNIYQNCKVLEKLEKSTFEMFVKCGSPVLFNLTLFEDLAIELEK